MRSANFGAPTPFAQSTVKRDGFFLPCINGLNAVASFS